jgi:hypothetical protein
MPLPPPFDNKDKKVGVITTESRSDRGRDRNIALETASEELLRAIEKRDAVALASAFRNAFQLVELEPHEESEYGEML